MAQWPEAHKVRTEFADIIAGLDAQQLETQSLCEKWTARGVLCHLAAFVDISAFGMISNMVKSGFNFEKMAQSMADVQLARPVADVIATLRENGANSAPMPGFPEELTVTDVVIHTQDVVRPLGLDVEPNPDRVRAALDFITTHKMGTTLVNRPPLDGISLSATDMDWTFGVGAQISGPAESLMMALADRPVLDELTGDGVAMWR